MKNSLTLLLLLIFLSIGCQDELYSGGTSSRNVSSDAFQQIASSSNFILVGSDQNPYNQEAYGY